MEQDTTPPETTISGYLHPVGGSLGTFTFTSTEAGSTFECRFDSVPFAACESPYSFSGLSDGPHTFQVQAKDPAGNVDPGPATYPWTQDTTPPETTITTSLLYSLSTGSATFTFTSTEAGSTFECRFDSVAFAACESPYSFSGLSDGPHTFEVQAIDLAGNPDTTPASHAWTVDTTPPDTIIDMAVDGNGVAVGSGGSTVSGSITFGFWSPDIEGVAGLECSLDGAGYAPCTSPKSYSGLSDGTYTFQVQAFDTVGNVDPTPASHAWTVDTTPPETTITGYLFPVGSSLGTFTFTSTEAGSTFECQLDSGGFVACASPYSFSGLSDGPHTFQVQAIDPAGNVDPGPATYPWTQDTTPPETTITTSLLYSLSTGSATFTFTSTEAGSTFECQLDSGVFVACVSPHSFSGLGDWPHPHTFQVQARDFVGNVDPTPASYDWTVDTTQPDTIITSGPPNLANSETATFTFVSSEAGSTFQCQLDGGVFAACVSPKSYSGLSDGTYTFQVRAKDPAGNVDATPASYPWTVDTTPPDTTITSGPPSLTNSSSATFTFVGSEAGGTFQCQRDGGGLAPCTSPKTYGGLGNGNHTFQVQAIDPAGNVDPTPATYPWTVDTVEPQTGINTAVDGNGDAVGNGGSAISPSITFSFVGTDNVGVSGFQCQLDGSGVFAACASPKSYSALAPGSHTFRVQAVDLAGNMDASPASFTWIVLTPAQAVMNLISDANSIPGLPPGVGGQLSSFNPSNLESACGKLNAFIFQVNANTKPPPGKPLTPGQATQLKNAANAIKASLGC